MGNVGYKLPGLHMPQIEKVDEFDEWIVWREHDGKREGKPCSSKAIAQADARYFQEQGYTNVSIEKRHVNVMGERPW